MLGDVVCWVAEGPEGHIIFEKHCNKLQKDEIEPNGRMFTALRVMTYKTSFNEVAELCQMFAIFVWEQFMRL